MITNRPDTPLFLPALAGAGGATFGALPFFGVPERRVGRLLAAPGGDLLGGGPFANDDFILVVGRGNHPASVP